MTPNTFEPRHTRSRQSVISFFSDDSMQGRLRRFVVEENSMRMVNYFLSPHYSHAIQREGKMVHLNEEYKAALSALKKRFFDFTSEPGKKSDLVWEGQVNPALNICPGVSMPLPTLVAMKWLISNDLDSEFWARFSHLKQHFDSHFLKVKTMYTETHKKKKRLARERVIKAVIASTKEQPVNKGRRNVLLTRNQRSLVSATLKAEKLELKEKRKRMKLTGKQVKTKRPRVTNQACAFVLKPSN